MNRVALITRIWRVQLNKLVHFQSIDDRVKIGKRGKPDRAALLASNDLPQESRIHRLACRCCPVLSNTLYLSADKSQLSASTDLPWYAIWIFRQK